jgi:predicted phosphodiesterase
MEKIFYKKDFNINNNEVIIALIGDVHYGSKNCDKENFEKTLDFVKKNKNIYVIGMGDLVDFSIKSSPGASAYEQEENMQGQLETMVEYLKPIANENRLLGLLQGNHEFRSYKTCGLDITKIMAKMLGTEFLGFSANLRLRVKDNIYKMFVTHGSSGAKYMHTKIKPCMQFAEIYDADIYAMGHVHELVHLEKPYFIQNHKNFYMKKKFKHFVLTGAYLKYDKSYAEMKGLQPSKIGSPKIKLNSLEHKIIVETGGM